MTTETEKSAGTIKVVIGEANIAGVVAVTDTIRHIHTNRYLPPGARGDRGLTGRAAKCCFSGC